MDTFKKIVLYYCLGMVFSFWIITVVQMNRFLFEPCFWCFRRINSVTTSLICGAPFGLAIWTFLCFKFRGKIIDLKFILKLLKPILRYYLVGIILALFLLEGIQIYRFYFVSEYSLVPYFKIVGFSIFLGLLFAILFYTLKNYYED